MDVIDALLTLPDGRAIGYRDRGDRSSLPVIYFHGQPGSRLEAELIPDAALAAVQVRLISFDRPGMGRSDLIPAQDMSIDIQDALSVADHLNVGRFAVIGVSAGGPPAIAISAIHPERVLRTVLSSASGPYDDETFMTDGDIDETRRLRAGGPASLLEEYEDERRRFFEDMTGSLARWFEKFPEVERAWISTPPAAPAVVADFTEALRQGARGWLRESEVRSLPWSFDPGTITCPVRAFHGERDTWELISNIRRTLEWIPRARLTVYPAGDHLAPLLHPYDLLRACVG